MKAEEFVEARLKFYETHFLPNGEWWEKAHHPLPQCLGGTEVVKLWARDHAVHGALQSEECGHPCLTHKNWHRDREFVLVYYPEFLPLLEKWQQKLVSYAASCVSLEASVKGGHAGIKAQKERKVGWFGDYINSELRQQTCARGGATGGPKTTSQVWISLHDGYLGSPPSVGKHNKSVGVPGSFKVRLSSEEAAFVFLWA